MTQKGAPMVGDQAKMSVTVAVDQADAFRIFTEEIDQWWRRGLRYRVAGARRSVLVLEPRLGGRLFEAFEDDAGSQAADESSRRVVETGRVTVWCPPSRLVFEWRSVAFAPSEKTEVEVTFEPAAKGTLVTVVHRGWSHIRPDHPARHGMEVPAFIRTMGLWWADLGTAFREHVQADFTS
ncbi:MAG: activator of HSP90 ATPase [Polyangiaceae bacterium]|nr:activator of HSP90 ATPase [Polyangiaceae bacterium]